MGLRDLLGLPPKKGKAGPAGKAEDRGPYDKAVANHDKLIADARYAVLPKASKDKLEAAKTEASGLAAHGKFSVAAKRLNGAIAIATKEIIELTTAKTTFDKASAIVSGLIDACRILGVPAKHIDEIKAKYDAAKAQETVDLKAAAAQMDGLAKATQKDDVIRKAKDARDRVNADRGKTEAAVNKALQVQPETPEAQRLTRLLNVALPLIAFNAGKTQYLEAARHMDNCAKWAAELEAEGVNVAANIKVRDDVLAARKKIDASVAAARKIFGTNPEDKAVVAEFGNIDKAFEGALYNKDYKLARSYLDRLAFLAKRVVELKPKSDAAMKLDADVKKMSADLAALYSKIHAVNDQTKEMIDILDRLDARVDDYDDALNSGNKEEALKIGPDAKALGDEYFKANESAKEEIAKGEQARQLYAKKADKRYNALLNFKPVLPALAQLIERVKAEYADADDNLQTCDFSAALACVEKLVATLDEADGLKAQEDAARKARSQGMAAYKKERAKLQKAFALKPYTPEVLALREQFVSLHEDFKKSNDAGDASAVDLLKQVVAAADALLKKEAENEAEKGKSIQEVDALLKAALGEFKLARQTGDKHKPFSQTMLDALTEQAKVMENAWGQRRTMETKAEHAKLMAMCKEIVAKVPDWKKAATADKDAVDARIGAVRTNYAEAMAYVEVSPEIKSARDAVETCMQDISGAYGDDKWPEALAALDVFDKDFAALKALKGKHDALVADKTWVEGKEASLGTKVADTLKDFALIPETADIQGRLSFQKSVADAGVAGLDYPRSRAAWVEIEKLLAEWDAKDADNDKGWTAEAEEVHRRHSAIETDMDTCDEINPITPELKPLHAAYSKDRKRFWTAYRGLDWPLALEILDSLEKTAPALAAKKPDFDTALVAAKQRSAQAVTELGGLSFAEVQSEDLSKQLQLIEDLRGTGEKMTPAERKLQRKLFTAIAVDPAFDKADKQRRDRLVDELKADDEVMQARGSWASKSDAERLSVLMKVLKAECSVYGIPEPQVRLFNEPPGDEGYFSSGTMTLNLNTHPDSGWSDFKEAVDTVVHENMHNYQAVLVQRLADGLIVPGDPEYEQARVFAANDGSGYIGTEEKPDPDETDQKPYRNQPVETHAWDTGGGVATELRDAKVEPPKGNKL